MSNTASALPFLRFIPNFGLDIFSKEQSKTAKKDYLLEPYSQP